MLFSWSVNRAFGATFEGCGAALVAISSENQLGTLSGISVWCYKWVCVCLAEQSTAIIP